MKSIISMILLSTTCLSMLAQEMDTPKREFRAAWVATAFNTDFPKRPIPLKVAHQEQYKSLLNRLERSGFNAVIMQVRVAGDAFYPSELVPWSAFLTGKQGMPPQPDFDLMEFMIEETHKRSMEFHAWFNPYRATMNLDTIGLAAYHVLKKNRGWMIKFGKRFYFNPGLESVRLHLTQVIMEVVNKYDIDAVHFDDYFYPYKVGDEVFNDSTLFLQTRGRFNEIGDWRRNNVDLFVQQLSEAIKSAKPHVKFVISPFGVWRNRTDDRRGSNTKASIRSYDDLNADILKWLRLGWIDYVIPQLYWNIGFEPADHETLVKWWSNNTSNKHLYIGHAAYKVGDNFEIGWDDPNEIPRQIQLNRKNYYSQGSAFFSTKSLVRNRLGVRDSIRHYYDQPSLIPFMEELPGKPVKAPALKKVRKKRRNPKLVWKADRDDIRSGRIPSYYVVYRFNGDQPASIDKKNHILAITPFNAGKKRVTYIDRTADPNEFYTYVVTSMNRLHNESPVSNAQTIYKTEKSFSRVKN